MPHHREWDTKQRGMMAPLQCTGQGVTNSQGFPLPRAWPEGWGSPDVTLQEEAAIAQVGRAPQAARHLPILLHDLDHLTHGCKGAGEQGLAPVCQFCTVTSRPAEGRPYGCPLEHRLLH